MANHADITGMVTDEAVKKTYLKAGKITQPIKFQCM